jgi:hypothetical protein
MTEFKLLSKNLNFRKLVSTTETLIATQYIDFSDESDSFKYYIMECSLDLHNTVNIFQIINT